MFFEGCQGKKDVFIEEKICPQCGNEIEIISTDSSAVCDRCGFTIYNDLQSCASWCRYAKLCMGDAMYKHMKQAAEKQKRELDS